MDAMMPAVSVPRAAESTTSEARVATAWQVH